MSEHPPKKKGTKDPLLAGLNEALSAPAKPIIPPELSIIFPVVPPKVLEKYSKITDPIERERLVKNLQISQQTQAERENTQRKVRKSAAPRTEKSEKRRGPKRKPQQSSPRPPAGLAPELLHAVEKSEAERQAKMHAEIAGWNSVNQTADAEPAGEDKNADWEAQRRKRAIDEASDAEIIAHEGAIRPNERQQRKLLKALLASDEDVENILKENDVEISPKERAKAMELLTKSDTGFRASRIIGGISQENKHAEYFHQLKLLKDEALTRDGSAKVNPQQAVEAPVYDWAVALATPDETAVVTEPVAQPAETPAEKFNKRAAEVAEMLKGHNLGDRDPIIEARLFMDFGRDKEALEILEETARKIKNGTYTTNARPPEVATAVGAEPYIGQEVEPQADQNMQQEGTPKENRDKFLETMARAKEIFGNFVEGTSERFAKSKNYLNERAKEIDSKASEMGSFEKYFRKFGEQYNKLSLIKKLGIGVTLGVGTAVGAAFSLPLALAGVAGLVVQRAAGSASMFLKIEKSLQDKKIGEKSYQIMAKKERAMLDAALYTFAFSYAIKEGLEAAQEHGTVERTREWLGAVMNEFTGNRTEAGAVATAPSVLPEKVQLQSDSAPLEQSAPAAEAPAPAAEVSEPAAAAAAGEPVPRPITAKSFPSPEAPARFEMPKHADFSIHEDDTEISPYDVTPTDQSGADDDIVQASEESQPIAEPEAVTETTRSMPVSQEAPAEPIEAVPEAEPPAEPLPNVKVPEPEKYATVDLTQEQVEVETAPAESMPAQVEHAKEWTNPNGVKIDPLRGGVYQYPNGVPVAYGKDALDAAQDFAKANPNTSVWVQSEKPVLYEGKLHQYVYEVKYGGFWRGMQILGADGPSDPSHIITIDPNALVKRLGE